MQPLFQLKLFSTAHCHLCDEAYALLKALGHAEQLLIIDIADDDVLLKQYGTRIPVLQRIDNLAELDWPFHATELAAFLQS